ncbi:hypothetical protein EDC04DRAFT_1491854 [Pisolithus marmoratus]|nr:hypothetical protein EDC04DRAFT_1491854 [Pisolithus marmoratus]
MGEEAKAITSTPDAKQRFQESVFRILLCTSSLDNLDEMSGEGWSKLSERLNNRTENINVVGALAVATAAVFLTTNAPDGVLLINWNRELPYFCLAACGGCGMLAVMSGLGLIVYLNGTDHDSIKKARQSPLKLVAIFTLLAMPLIFLSVASLCAGVAWLGAVWYGETLWIKLIVSIGCIIFLFTLFVIGFVLY